MFLDFSAASTSELLFSIISFLAFNFAISSASFLFSGDIISANFATAVACVTVSVFFGDSGGFFGDPGGFLGILLLITSTIIFWI